MIITCGMQVTVLSPSAVALLTFRGPCIVMYSYNKTNEMH